MILWFNDSWTRGFELVTRWFEIVTRGFEFQFVLLTRNSQLVTRNSCFTISRSECASASGLNYYGANIEIIFYKIPNDAIT